MCVPCPKNEQMHYSTHGYKSVTIFLILTIGLLRHIIFQGKSLHVAKETRMIDDLSIIVVGVLCSECCSSPK